MERALVVLLRTAARMLPPARRQWAEALQAEAGQVPAGRTRVHWLAGGLWLVAREGSVTRKVAYWLGIGAVAAAAAWTVWVSWRTVSAADGEITTDRVRILVGLVALIVLPWAGRKRGWFGPVGSGAAARAFRVVGCAAVCGLGVALIRIDSHAGNNGIGYGAFNWMREVGGLTLFGAVLAMPPVLKARWPQLEASTLWSLAGLAGVVVWAIMPVQLLTIGYFAAILAATSRRSPVTGTSLVAGTVTGLATGLIIFGLAAISGDIGLTVVYPVVASIFALAIPAGIASAWRLGETDNSKEGRETRIRQGLLAGTVSGAVCSLLLTYAFIGFGLMMVFGPMIGVVGGAVGGAIAADHPRNSPRQGSWAAGLFFIARDGQTS
jgi:hypothetical protein